MFFLLLFSLLSVGYYDLVVKFAVKNYYELFQMDSKIYTQPLKNKNLKIDSLSVVGAYMYPLKYSITLSNSEKEEIASMHENYIEKFIDISTFTYKFNKYTYNTERVYLNSYKYDNSLISNSNEEAKFVISKSHKESFFPKIYDMYEYKFLDRETNTVIATAFKISFLTSYTKFRNKYLFWTQEKEDEFNLPAIENFDNIYKKLFLNIK
ncbi:hypothetical protein [Arcobacter sp. s6]|uniref:hypothetical protein n=1 Tax=Arcobacter sp. s6 TaxID=3230363 RepID=UPI0034A08B91